VSTPAVGCALFQIPSTNRYGLYYSVHHSVSSPIGVELAIGAVGQNGLLDKELRRTGSPIIGTDEVLDDDELDHWLRDQYYIQVRSTRFPNGEIRGQVNRVKPCQVSRYSTITVSNGGTASAQAGQAGQRPVEVDPIRYTPAPYSVAAGYLPLVVDYGNGGNVVDVSVPYSNFYATSTVAPPPPNNNNPPPPPNNNNPPPPPNNNNPPPPPPPPGVPPPPPGVPPPPPPPIIIVDDPLVAPDAPQSLVLSIDLFVSNQVRVSSASQLSLNALLAMLSAIIVVVATGAQFMA
jgi:hypothetical protein